MSRKHKQSFAQRSGNVVISITPSPLPSNSSSPTPSPQQYLGYCLQVPVLFYHHVAPYAIAIEKGQTAYTVDNGMFDQHMAYLVNNGYKTITAKQLVDALRTKSQLPQKSVAITIDDGYKDIYEYAFPILRKYNSTANLMISTGLLEGVDYLTWNQLQEMVRSGLISVTNHTWSHYNVGAGPYEKVVSEIQTAKRQLEEHGIPTDVFTYPYGLFSDDAIAILQQNGYIGAFTTISGQVQCDSFIMTLRRTRIGNSSLINYGL